MSDAEKHLKGYALCRAAADSFYLLVVAIWALGASIFAPWGCILRPLEHPGRPWEQKDGHEGSGTGFAWMTEITPGSIWDSSFESLFGGRSGL